MKTNAFSCKRDRLTIRGKEFLPKEKGGPEKRKLPALIFSHGFMADVLSTQMYGRYFAKRGYAAYCFDFNGGGPHGKSDGKTEEMSVMTEVEDLLAVIEHVKTLPYIDRERIVLVGYSQGGLVSALAAARIPEEIAGLMLCFPALCIPDHVRAGKISSITFDREHIPKTMQCKKMLLGDVYPKDIMELDPFEEIGKFKGPVLLLHGSRDPVVSLEYSKRAMAVYNKECIRCQLVTVDGAGHGFYPGYDGVTLDAMMSFLKGYRLILEVDVRLTGKRVEKRFRYKKTTLPFKGSCDTPWFKGSILPGGKDVQERKSFFEVIRFRAEYTMEGKDTARNDCRVHVVNLFDGKKWQPAVTTDSGALDFLNRAKCRCMLQGRPGIGPVVRIYAKISTGI